MIEYCNKCKEQCQGTKSVTVGHYFTEPEGVRLELCEKCLTQLIKGVKKWLET